MNHLFDALIGERLYLNAEERKTFFIKAQSRENDIKYYSLMLYYTGCRPSEVLNLMVRSIDFEDKSVIVRSLKKGRKDKPKIHYRHIPLPDDFLNELGSLRLTKTAEKPKSVKRKHLEFYHSHRSEICKVHYGGVRYYRKESLP